MWQSMWHWIGEHHQPVSVLVTAAGVGAAIFYAILTRRLWRAALGQADQAKRQADITQRMFEASYRPYLQLLIAEGSHFITEQAYWIRFTACIHGSLPGFLTSWQATLTGPGIEIHGRSPEPWRVSIFPGDSDSFVVLQGPGGAPDPRRAPRVELELVVHYRGSPKLSTYQSRLVAVQDEHGNWCVTDEEDSVSAPGAR